MIPFNIHSHPFPIELHNSLKINLKFQHLLYLSKRFHHPSIHYSFLGIETSTINFQIFLNVPRRKEGMDHVCRTAAFDRHEYLGTRYNRARIRAMFRKVDGGESKRGQINKEGNGSSLSSLFIIQRAHIRLFPCSNRFPALHRFIVVQLESITGHARPYSNFFRQPSRAETLLSYSH